MMNVKIPDPQDLQFVQRCTACGGDRQRDEWVPNMVERVLRGKVRMVDAGGWLRGPCSLCNATGVQLTAFGERMVEFMQSMGVVIPDVFGWQKLSPPQPDDR